MSENTEDTEKVSDSALIQPMDDKAVTGALASWEEPRLSFRERLRKNWRQMLVRLWGPTGSLVFHIVVIAILVFATTKVQSIIVSPDTPILQPPKAPDLDPPTKSTEPPPPVPPANERDGDPGVLIPGGPTTVESEPDTHPVASSFGTDTSLQAPRDMVELSPKTTRLHMPNLYVQRTAINRNKLTDQWGTQIGPPGDGGMRPTETAVLRALRWLKANQNANGSWAGSKMNVPPAMTGLALLAYLGHGDTPESKEFGTTIKKAMDWLIASQKADGSFEGRDANDYTQPICAYALCEAYGMTQHPTLKDAALKAITVVVNGQHASGGFNYKLETATERNDSSYMAWCCQALKSAKMAHLDADVPDLEKTMNRARAGFKQNAAANGGFGYTSPGATGLSGAGALSLQMLGDPQAIEVKNTMKFLETATFSFTDWKKQPYSGESPLYYWYYVTQAKFQYADDTFRQWNKMFAPELCHAQLVEKDAIADANGKRVAIGHWESPSAGEHSGGVVQDTCLCTLMLEVYYRFLPSYQRVEAPDATATKKQDEKDIIIKVQL